MSSSVSFILAEPSLCSGLFSQLKRKEDKSCRRDTCHPVMQNICIKCLVLVLILPGTEDSAINKIDGTPHPYGASCQGGQRTKEKEAGLLSIYVTRKTEANTGTETSCGKAGHQSHHSIGQERGLVDRSEPCGCPREERSGQRKGTQRRF